MFLLVTGTALDLFKYLLLEDLGALLGLAIALVGVGFAVTTGDGRFDGIASITIGLMLGAIAVVMAVEMKSLLIGESARIPMRADIVAVLEGHPQVVRVIHMRTQHLGPDELLVAAKLEFASDLTAPDLAGVIDALEANLRERVPIARAIYLEPDVHHGPEDPEAG